MCLCRCRFNPRPLDKTTRCIWQTSQLCLSAGLLLQIFAKDYGHRHRTLYDGLRALLFGLAINCFFWTMRHARHTQL